MMDLSEDEDDAEDEISELLNALEGIEQCFVADSEIQKPKLEATSSLSSVMVRKRPIEPVPLTIPTVKKISLHDPRLEKVRSLPVVPKAPLLPVPNFVKSNDLPQSKTSNSEKLRSKKPILKPIVISTQLSKYLNLNSSLHMKSKQTLANKRGTSHDPRKSSASAKKPKRDVIATKKMTVLEYISKKPFNESRKILTPLEKVKYEHISGSTSIIRTDKSSTGPTLKENSKYEENTDSQQLPLSVTTLNRAIVEDILNGINVLPVEETNSVTHDAPMKGSVVTRNPDEVSDCPIKFEVPTVIRERESVSISENLKKSLHVSWSLDNALTLEKAESDVGYSEKAPKESILHVEKKTSPVKETKSKQINCNKNSWLPSEVLIKVFEYLPLRDKKTAKLVCKLWYDTCNIKLFMMRQRFVCCGIYDTTSILRTLTDSGCTYFNLEFHRVDFCAAFSAYWKQLGPKIHALYFVDCILAEETLQDVIVNCSEMEHLTLSFERLKVPSLKLFSLTLFENLFKRRVERPKLVSMDIQINSNGWFSNAIISNLFGIYPNVSRLRFTCHTLDPVASGIEAVPPSKIDFTDLWSSKALTFSPILKYVLSPPDSMEKLKLDAHTKGMRTGFAWQLVISNSKFTRLREIVIEIDLKKLSGNAVIEFCIAQPELKSVTCKIIGPAKLFISLFLLKLLDNCHRLRNLDVTYKAPFIISYELFKRLVASKLKSLSIESSNVLLAPQITDEIEWPTNRYLRTLSLSEGVGNTLKNLLIGIFRNLRFLEIHCLCDELLQLIWKFQTNLVTLKLVGVEECTIDGFCGVPENTSSCSIRNLQNLEYLVLETVNNEWDVYGNVFSEFQFPNLRYFCVDIEGSTTLQNDLFEAMQNFTKLEGVSITCSGVERSVWLQMNKNWKNLRYLRIVDKESLKFKMKHYCKYFKTSPNLRALFHEFKGSTESYYYDVLEKTIKKKLHRAKYRVTSEKVGNCFLDWLWF